MTTTRKKLIEVSIPLEAINAEAQRRKQKAPKGYPTSIHKYWAQRPIAACRAVLFAQLVDDPSAWPGRYPFPEIANDEDAERRRLHRVIEAMVPWEASNDEAILNAARWEIARSVAWGLGEEPPSHGDRKAILDYLQTKAPPVYDPFSGGGSIPLEAQRLGLRAHGSDLNPVAVLIGKALAEIPPKFAGLPPVNPEAQAELKRGGQWNGSGAQGLAEDVRYYGRWIRDEADQRIGHLYPKTKLPDGSEATIVAWIWARTVRSPDPAAGGAYVPLLSTYLLSQKSKAGQVWLHPVIDDHLRNAFHFEIKSGAPSSDEMKSIRAGLKTGRGSNFTCLLSGSAIPEQYVKAEGRAGRLDQTLVAMVAEAEGKRFYLAASEEHSQVALSIVADWAPSQEMPENPRWFSPPEFGLKTYGSLFTSRQLECLSTMTALVPLVAKKVKEDSDRDDEYATAVATYIAFAVDRMATYGSSLCKWLVKDNALAPSIPQQAIPMAYDFAESNPFGKSSGAIAQCINVVASCLEHAPYDAPAHIAEVSAQESGLDLKYVLATDPPYYDNIGYADISEFFYVWLSRSLKELWPNHFRRLTTPKDSELVATPYRHGGTEAAERYFEAGIKVALSNLLNRSSSAWPVTIFYAFKQTEGDSDGVSSKGWASFLQGLVDGGAQIDGTWPLRTELTSALKSGINSLASSVVLVCLKRDIDAPIIARADFVRLLKRELPSAIDAIRKAGVGPVDMQQSVIGPGMGVFSRHAKVLEDDDSAMTVKTALALINRVWEEIENELDGAFDAETQVALAWYGSYGFDARPSGELITLTTAKNTSDRALFQSGVFANLSGRAALVSRDKLPADWSPAADKHLTVWECVQHTAARLNAENGGTDAAARLVAQMGAKSTDALKLADRLFHVATNKGWSAEALVYNELAEVWPKLEDAASTIDAGAGQAAPAQRGLFEGVA